MNNPCFHRQSSAFVSFTVATVVTTILAATMCFASSAAISAAPGSASSTGASKTPKRYSIEQFFATTRISGASFSADEKKILFNNDASGIFNAYTIPAAGGKAEPLTRSTTDSTFAQSYFPKDDRILISRAKGGDENDHVFVRELDGTERDLTPGDKVKAAFFGWHPDGAAFYITTNERDPKMFDVYRYDAKTTARTLLFKNEQALQPGAISHDEKWIAFNKPNTTIDSDIYLYNVAKTELKHITSHQGSISFSAQTFDPQSRQLLFLSDEGSEFARVRTYDLATGAVKEREQAEWDISYTYFSRDGRYRVTGINQDASVVIRVVEIVGETEKSVVLPKLPGGAIRGVTFSRNSARMAFYLNGDRSPSNLFVFDFKTRQVKQLTQSLSKDINPADLADAEVVRFKSFDGMVIPGIYYKPHGASPANKVPAIVMVHGGPGGQASRRYSAEIQYLVNNGYAVL
ncbi:MAG: S9 family peptidase, partial [Pseudomonadota bacterium]